MTHPIPLLHPASDASPAPPSDGDGTIPREDARPDPPAGAEGEASMGLASFMKRLRRLCPWLRYGYFNPWLGDRAALTAPLPGEWRMPAPGAAPVRERTLPDIDDGKPQS